MAKHKQEQAQAVAAATEKLRAELQAPGADAAQVTAKHAGELKALEIRLVTKHETEMKAALDKLRTELSQPNANGESGKTVSSVDHEQALKAATERGRMEVTAKLKLKDSMLTKAQNNVKQLEAQIKAWKDAGLLPVSDNATSGTTAATVSAVAKAVPSPTTSAPPAASTSAATTVPNALPRKPGGALSGSVPLGRGGAVVRGRGVVRGALRGGAPGRGGAPPTVVAPVADTTTVQGVSIIGAAGKRTREDGGEANAADSLAKRLKPTDGVTKPVAFRRDRIPPQPPQPPTTT